MFEIQIIQKDCKSFRQISDQMLGCDYVRKHEEVIIGLQIVLYKNIALKTNKTRSYIVQKTMFNDNVELRIDARIYTDIMVNHNKADIFALGNKRKEYYFC